MYMLNVIIIIGQLNTFSHFESHKDIHRYIHTLQLKYIKSPFYNFEVSLQNCLFNHHKACKKNFQVHELYFQFGIKIMNWERRMSITC